jgi:hypothetical protein
MSKNKQPRDKNGKFAKMIKVEDKYGNVAYFTPEEMAGFKATSKNPDCKPATRGYVKELMRKTREHTHEFTGEPFFTGFGALIGFVATIGFALGMGTTPNFVAWGWYPPVGPSIAFTLACFMFFLDNVEISVKGISEPTPKELYRYTPPRKDECEEEEEE